MAPPDHVHTLMVKAVPLLLHWLAPLGDRAAQRCEAAKEACNRGCQLLSVHGTWSWLPLLTCMITRSVVSSQSALANMDSVLPHAWDYGRLSMPVQQALMEMSVATAALWRMEMLDAAAFLGEFSSWLDSVNEPQTGLTIRHAANGCQDLADLIQVYISNHETPDDFLSVIGTVLMVLPRMG